MEILVIEDDYFTRLMVEHVLANHGHKIESVELGQEGESKAIQNAYDCIILDLTLPDKNGIEVCRNIRASEVKTPILILSAHKTTDIKVTGLNAGADDYLTKPFENKELLARIGAVTRRTRDQVKELNEYLQFGELKVDLIERIFTVKGQNIFLTKNEFNLITYFLKNPERVIGIDELTKNVWEMNFDSHTNFMNVYISYLRKKINEVTSKKYIRTVRKKGFILIDKEGSRNHLRDYIIADKSE
ncbi:MAG: response regulator transcription factor [Balneolales bacterium]